jgi:hypothetical protein
MKNAAMLSCFAAFALSLMLGFGCSKSDAPAAGNTAAADKPVPAPSDTLKNFAAAVAKKDAAAAVACFSKEYVANAVWYIRESAKKYPEKLSAQGLSPEDLKLSDEAFFVKLIAKNFETGFEDTMAVAELAVLNEKTEGVKSVIYARDKKKRTLEFSLAKDESGWKITGQNYRSFKQFEPVQVLEAIRAAQEKYKAAHGNYGMFGYLKEEGFLDPAMLERGAAGDYEFAEEVPTTDAWEARALPHNIDNSDEYKIDQAGIIKVKHPGKEEFENYGK